MAVRCSRTCVLALTLWAMLAADAAWIGAQSPESSRAMRAAEPAQRAVLVLIVDDPTRPWSQLIAEGIREVFQNTAPAVTLYQEFLDSARFEDSDYTEGLRDWLRRKYAGRRIDLLIVPGQEAVAFLSRAGGEPWPGVPIVWAEVGALTIDIHDSLPGAIGVIFESGFQPALRVIKTILPQTTRVVLVYGASALERARFANFATDVRGLGLEPIDLGGLTMDDLRQRVARQPEDAVIVNLSIQVDAAGRTFAPRHPCRLLSEVANRPLFSLPTHEFGCGVVGGLLRDFKKFGELTAEYGLKRLDDPAVGTVHVPVDAYSSLLFDARQLDRWGIDEERLPAGSVVQFRSPSLWRDYRPQVIAGVTIACVQALLIAGLLFEHRRRRRAELDARRHLATMAHMDRRAALGELSTSLAHELNQPLTAILQNARAAEILLASHRDGPVNPEIREILQDIRQDDQRASEIIKRMRALLQKHGLETQPVDVNTFVRETTALVLPDATARGIRIEAELGQGLDVVLGDRIHLQQVLLNLLLNALDAQHTTPPERRRVVVRTVQVDGTVTVSVKDAGPGISADPISRIFDPFYTTKSEHAGMGIGLSIARTIVEAHGGQMTAANNPDVGATVAFTLPAARISTTNS